MKEAIKRGLTLFLLALVAACGKEAPTAWQGYIEGEYVLLASPYAGQLQKLHLRRGDQAVAGKPVFALEQENERQQRVQAEEQLKSAEARLKNLEVPLRPPQIEALKEQLAQAKAARALSAVTSSCISRETSSLSATSSRRSSTSEARVACSSARARSTRLTSAATDTAAALSSSRKWAMASGMSAAG